MTTDVLDPYEELLCEAKKRQQVDDAELKLSHAKVRIISGRCLNGCESSQQLMQKSRGVSAFFGSLIRRTKYVSSFDEDTAATNGKNTYYNPEFVASLDIDETIFLLCHEACHDGFGHHAIIRGLDLEMANAAADLAVNSLLEAGGFKLIKGALRPSVPFKFRGHLCGPFDPMLSLWQYYQALLQIVGDGSDGDGDDGDNGSPKPWHIGKVCPGEKDSKAADKEEIQRSKQALAQAQQEAKSRGELPQAMERYVDGLLEAKVDWRAVTRNFLSATIKKGRSWSRPRRTWAAQGIYAPGSTHRPTIGHLVIINDTSGSLDTSAARQLFRSEVEGILQTTPPTEVTIVHHDSEPQRVEHWIPGDGELPWHPIGGGGTDHRWMRSFLDKLPHPANLVICLTDLETMFGDAPRCPVLWATTIDHSVPWGKKVLITDE